MHDARGASPTAAQARVTRSTRPSRGADERTKPARAHQLVSSPGVARRREIACLAAEARRVCCFTAYAIADPKSPRTRTFRSEPASQRSFASIRRGAPKGWNIVGAWGRSYRARGRVVNSGFAQNSHARAPAVSSQQLFTHHAKAVRHEPPIAAPQGLGRLDAGSAIAIAIAIAITARVVRSTACLVHAHSWCSASCTKL